MATNNPNPQQERADYLVKRIAKLEEVEAFCHANHTPMVYDDLRELVQLRDELKTLNSVYANQTHQAGEQLARDLEAQAIKDKLERERALKKDPEWQERLQQKAANYGSL